MAVFPGEKTKPLVSFSVFRCDFHPRNRGQLRHHCFFVRRHHFLRLHLTGPAAPWSRTESDCQRFSGSGGHRLHRPHRRPVCSHSLIPGGSGCFSGTPLQKSGRDPLPARPRPHTLTERKAFCYGTLQSHYEQKSERNRPSSGISLCLGQVQIL